MTRQRLIAVFEGYRQILEERCYIATIERAREDIRGHLLLSQLRHSRWLCTTASALLRLNSTSPDFQPEIVLGFVQGVFWANGYFSLAELAEHMKEG